jgi:hypothetical protein
VTEHPPLGSKIRFKPSYRYASDWPGEFFVIGLNLNVDGKVDVTIAEGITQSGTWVAPTSDFSTKDMEVVPSAPDHPYDHHHDCTRRP